MQTLNIKRVVDRRLFTYAYEPFTLRAASVLVEPNRLGVVVMDLTLADGDHTSCLPGCSESTPCRGPTDSFYGSGTLCLYMFNLGFGRQSARKVDQQGTVETEQLEIHFNLGTMFILERLD